MLITLPFFAFASLKAMPYIQHLEKEDELPSAGYSQENQELHHIRSDDKEKKMDYTKYSMDVSV